MYLTKSIFDHSYTPHCWAQASSHHARAWAIVSTLAQCELGTSHTSQNYFAVVCRFPYNVYPRGTAHSIPISNKLRTSTTFCLIGDRLNCWATIAFWHDRDDGLILLLTHLTFWLTLILKIEFNYWSNDLLYIYTYSELWLTVIIIN